MSDIFAKNPALKALLDAHLDTLASEEGLSPEAITEAIAKGTMVLLANPSHKNVKPILVGQPSRIKVNANMAPRPCAATTKTRWRSSTSRSRPAPTR